MIEVSCPHCGFELRIKPKYAGLEGKCMECKGRLRVPRADEPQVAIAVAKKAKDLKPSEVPAAVPPPPMNRELRTESSAPKSAPPIDSTTLADLGAPAAPHAPAKPPAPPASTSLDDLQKVDDAELLHEGAVDLSSAERPRSGGQLWILIAALVIGVPFVLFTIFAVGTAVFRDSSPQVVQDGVVTPPTESSPAAVGPRPPIGPAPGPRSRQTPAYAATGLPTYPGLVFSTAPHTENPLYAKLNAIDPSTMQTFRAVTAEDNEEVSKSFYLQLEAQNWSIADSGMGDQANKEIYIIGSKNGQTLAYYTVAVGEGAAVYVTLAGAAPGDGPEVSEPSEQMVAIPLDQFPHYPGLELAPGSALPSYVTPMGDPPNYQAAFEGTVAATFPNVMEFYRDALEGGRWDRTSFTEADEPEQRFLVKGGHGDFRYVMEGKPTTRGTHVVLAFVQPGTPW